MSEAVSDTVLPEAVRRQIRRADELAREATAEAQAREAAARGEPVPTVEGQPPQEQPPREQTHPREQQFQREQTQQPQQPQQPEAQPQPQPQRTAEYWEQRFNTLQGKYDKEVPTLQARLRAAEAQVSQLHNTVAHLNMARAAEPPPAPAGGQNTAVSAEDVESYGQEFIDKVRAWSGASANNEIASLKHEVERLRGQTQSATARMTAAQVETALDGQVPGWRETNDDPLFLDWLNNADPFSGQIRLAMLNEAYTKGDVSRTANFFLAFKREQTATSSAGSQQAHTPSQGAGTVPLADLAAPGRGRPVSAGASPEKRIWTHAQIAAFYRDAAAGRYAANEDLRKKLENDIFAAGSEGRIR